MTDTAPDPDQFLRQLLIEQVLGGAEGMDRLVDAAFAGDHAGVADILDGADHATMCALISQLLVFAVTAANTGAQKSTEMLCDALRDIRDHGGSLDLAIAVLGATLTGKAAS